MDVDKLLTNESSILHTADAFFDWWSFPPTQVYVTEKKPAVVSAGFCGEKLKDTKE